MSFTRTSLFSLLFQKLACTYFGHSNRNAGLFHGTHIRPYLYQPHILKGLQPVDSTLLVTELLQPKPGHIWRAPSPPPVEDQLALVSPNLVIWQRPPRGLYLFSCYLFLLTIIGTAISILLSVHLRQFVTMDWLNLCDNFVLKSNMLLLLLSCFSHVQLLATPWTAAHQAPRSMGFSRQEYWSGVPLPSLKI